MGEIFRTHLFILGYTQLVERAGSIIQESESLDVCPVPYPNTALTHDHA